MRQMRLLLAAATLLALTGFCAESALAALLGIQPGYPLITFDSLGNADPYGTSFDAGSGVWSVSGVPVSYLWASRKLVSIAGSRSLAIQAHLDGSGNLVADQPGDGIVITGEILPNASYTGPAYSGTLLTGKITRFGFYNGGSTDSYDLRFTPTGGALFELYRSSDIGITLTSENSTFNGSFGASFRGYAKGTAGAVTGPHFELSESCSDAVGGAPIEFSATITNTGTESLTGITCQSTPEAPLSGVPAELPVGASATITGSSQPVGNPWAGSLTCSGSGATSQVLITRSGSATCGVIASPSLVLDQICSDAAAPGEPIVISATLTNSGDEPLTGISCSDSKGAALSGVPATLQPGGSASLSGSYLPAESGSTDSIACSARGLFDARPVSASSSATCGIRTAPALIVAETCSNAPAPGEPITISALLTNTGNETLTGFSCTDSMGAALSGVPATLHPGATAAVTGSYLPAASASTDAITCSASGAINGASVSASSSSTCSIVTHPSLTVAESCSNAPAPGQPIRILAVITNTGNETLTRLSCSDSQGGTLSPLPSSLAPNGSVTVTGSYLPTSVPSSDSITCSASGAISSASVLARSGATCGIDPAICIKIRKQVSTFCEVAQERHDHCAGDERKEEYCRRGDADRGYCRDAGQSKQSYCHEVAGKKSHCGSSESKRNHCSRSDCDRKYCDRDQSKDDYCRPEPAPVCLPVWLDADSEESAAVLNGSAGGNDLLAKLLNGSQRENGFSALLSKLRREFSHGHEEENNRGGNQEYRDRDRDRDHRDDDGKREEEESRPQALMYRFIVTNCGGAELGKVVINDPSIAVTDYQVGPLHPGETVTLTAERIPQLARPQIFCSAPFVNSATVTGTDPLGRSASASDDAWVTCGTRNCAFTQGYWENHPGSWPVDLLKIGSVSYTQSQLIAIFRKAPAGNGLVSLAHQLIAAKLNAAGGSALPPSTRQAILDADALIRSLLVPPVGSGTLSSREVAALVQALDSYNSGTLSGGPGHCGEAEPPQPCTGKKSGRM